jgi:hypothetical protein
MLYRVFICHSYRHSTIYNELRARLQGARYFSWRNESVPDDMLVETSGDEELTEAIKQRIDRSDVVLVLTKPVAGRSRWLKEEIRYAQETGKPIIGITRRLRDHKSSLVLEAANVHVATWRTDDIVEAIREQVRKHKKRTGSMPVPVADALEILRPQSIDAGQDTPQATPREVLTDLATRAPALANGAAALTSKSPISWWRRVFASGRQSR